MTRWAQMPLRIGRPRLSRPRVAGRWGKKRTVALLLVTVALALTSCVEGDPGLSIAVGGSGEEGVASDGTTVGFNSVQLLGLLTVLALAPAFLIMVTSFTRTIVVLSLVRNAIGVPQLPPNQVLLGLALFLTIFVMAPTFEEINETALQPYFREELSQGEAFKIGQEPLREFMFKQTREQDLGLFVKLSGMERPGTPADVPTHVLIPAFIISELKTAFQMGFIAFVPFLIIDIVVSSALLSMGMMMLPPVLISLPFKILLFVLVDGWFLIVGSLAGSFS